MEKGGWTFRLFGWMGLLVWLAVVAAPLVWLVGTLRVRDLPGPEVLSVGRYVRLWGYSLGAGAVVATLSVLGGFSAGRLIGANAWARRWGPVFLVAALLVPPQVTYYAWGLVLLPTSKLGMFIAGSDTLIRLIGQIRSVVSLGLWHWPLCGLVLGLAWQRTDPEIWSQARLEAGPIRRWAWVGLPMLRSAAGLSWMLVFILVLSQFCTFHLAGADTVGTELAGLYQLTGNVHTTVWASIPFLVPAVAVGLWMERFLTPLAERYDVPNNERVWRGHWVIAGLLWSAGVLVPVWLLIWNVQGWSTFVQFGRVSWDGLVYSGAIAAVGAAMAVLIGLGVWSWEQSGRTSAARWMRVAVFVSALIPGALTAMAMVHAFNRPGWPERVYQTPWMVSAGHAASLSVLAVLMIGWVRSGQVREVTDLARLDGAGGWSGLVHVWLPNLGPGILAAALLALMLSVTELSVTMVLLPAGVPNFAVQLLNQMHYARDQQVIVSCLLLIGSGAVVAGLVFGLVRLGVRRKAFGVLLAAGLLAGGGCNSSPGLGPSLSVEACFGTTGRGEGQFIYPRGIAVAPDDTFFVVDKTARIQHLDVRGRYLGGWTMPAFQTGKPIGLRVGPDGLLYVADTHYHRVMIYTVAGKLVRQFGSLGSGPGQFIYPTDIEIAPDGRIFVSEYGGNDRVNIFTREGKFIKSFGSLGDRVGQFSRPAALYLDARRVELYVADACNHRIVRYDLEGKPLNVLGEMGREPGKLCYPYDLCLLPDGSLLVTEYGNNRIQRLSCEGRSLGVWGRAGREVGELLYPWGAVIDSRGRAIVLDSGNNRIQVWRIL